MPPVEFHSLVLPEGVEKRVLYHSNFRAVATYAMDLAELDRELQHILRVRGCTIKDDARRNLCGRLDVVTSTNEIVHVLTDTCGKDPTSGSATFVQLKYWVDF
jgi:hypothetical protein